MTEPGVLGEIASRSTGCGSSKYHPLGDCGFEAIETIDRGDFRVPGVPGVLEVRGVLRDLEGIMTARDCIFNGGRKGLAGDVDAGDFRDPEEAGPITRRVVIRSEPEIASAESLEKPSRSSIRGLETKAPVLTVFIVSVVS